MKPTLKVFIKQTQVDGHPSPTQTNIITKTAIIYTWNHFALNNPRVFTPSSSLAFVRITDTEHQILLLTGCHALRHGRYASSLYMHADLAKCAQI